MTLIDLVEEVFEKTHVDRAEILERAVQAWPRVKEFSTTQCRLLERAVQRSAGAQFRAR